MIEETKSISIKVLAFEDGKQYVDVDSIISWLKESQKAYEESSEEYALLHFLIRSVIKMKHD